VWIRLARLLYNKNGSLNETERAIELLEQAIEVIPMHQPDYFTVLVQLFCIRLATVVSNEKDDTTTTTNLFQRILILAPGFKQQQQATAVMEHPVVATLPNLPEACRLHVSQMLKHNGIAAFRKAYDAMLSSSCWMGQWVQATDTAESVQLLLDDIIEVEQQQQEQQGNKHHRKKNRLARLYDTAIQTFEHHSPALAAQYRQRKADEIQYCVGYVHLI
jgi:hypothetical protein